MTDDLDAVQLRALEEMVGPQRMRQIVERFFGHAPTRLKAAREAVAGGDAKRLSEALHSLRSSAGMLGAKAFVVLIESLEKNLQHKHTAALVPDLERLEAGFEQARRSLEERCRKMEP